MTEYKSVRIIDGKAKWTIVDENRKIINRNPSNKELENLADENCRKKKNERYDDNELLNYLKIFYDKNGRVPIETDFENSEYPNPGTYHRRFGSWNKSLILSELDTYINKEKYTDSELLNYLKIFYDKNGNPPTTRDFNNNPEYPGTTIYCTRFGSWNKALILAGINIDKNEKNKYTNDKLLNYLKIFYDKNGRVPTSRNFKNNNGYPGSKIFFNRFGSWNKALEMVGLDIDTMIKRGILETKQQKGRLSEIIVRDHFKNNPIDLSGNNQTSPCDGICPNGRAYDVKSAGLIKNRDSWSFNIKNKYKEEIEIFYLLGFNRDYTEFIYGWRVPGEIIEKECFIIGMYGGKFNVGNMIEYEITDKFEDIIKNL